ncbi:MAG: ABC transporter substrate-binding protein, partial [Hyphomicrobiales bacterium]
MRAGSAAAAIVLAGNPAWAQSQIPAGYPADYAALLEGSRSEPDTLIYSNLQLTNWAKVLQGFKARYPWTNVKIVDLGSETFERYYAETATGGRTADMILSGGVDGWHEFVQKSGAKPYASPEAPSLPAWAQNAPGVYTVACDPALIIYNKRIISEAEAPKSLHAIAELIKKRPDLMKRLTTQSVSVSFGRAAAWAWIQHNKDAWDILQTLGPATRPERAVGGILEKISTGEHA